jgi:hypothetical protein
MWPLVSNEINASWTSGEESSLLLAQCRGLGSRSHGLKVGLRFQRLLLTVFMWTNVLTEPLMPSLKRETA